MADPDGWGERDEARAFGQCHFAQGPLEKSSRCLRAHQGESRQRRLKVALYRLRLAFERP